MSIHPPLAKHIRMLLKLQSDATRPMDEAETHLDVERYYDEGRYRAECEQLFRASPIIVARADDLPKAGHCVTHDLLGVPILLVRGRDGRLRAFLNVCRHRNTRLIDEAGVCRKSSFVCPYHQWTYGLDGALLNIPNAEGFPTTDPAEHGLAELPLAERHGFVWVLPRQGAMPDIADYLGELDGDLAAFDLKSHTVFADESVDVAANWKMAFDAFFEGYHIKRLHRQSLAGFFLDDMVTIEPVGRHIRAAVARAELAEAAERPEPEWDVRSFVTFTYYIFPNSLFVISPDYVNHLTFYPTGPESVRIVDRMLVDHEPANDKERDHWRRSFELIHGGVFAGEDFHIAEQAQIGIRSGANTHLTLGRYERGIRIFHEILDGALGEAG